MSYVLQQSLHGLCHGTGWVYAVFWKLKKRQRMVLTWEDGFYEPAFVGSSLAEGSAANTGNLDLQLLALAVAKMSYQIYSVGEGIIGRVAANGKHQWVFGNGAEAPSIQGPEVLDEKCPAGWQNQFMAGIKTIAVIAVPQGVVQLGSIQMMPEDYNTVNVARNIFSALENTPGAYISDLFMEGPAQYQVIHPMYPMGQPMHPPNQPYLPPPQAPLMQPMSMPPGMSYNMPTPPPMNPTPPPMNVQGEGKQTGSGLRRLAPSTSRGNTPSVMQGPGGLSWFRMPLSSPTAFPPPPLQPEPFQIPPPMQLPSADQNLQKRPQSACASGVGRGAKEEKEQAAPPPRPKTEELRQSPVPVSQSPSTSPVRNSHWAPGTAIKLMGGGSMTVGGANAIHHRAPNGAGSYMRPRPGVLPSRYVDPLSEMSQRMSRSDWVQQMEAQMLQQRQEQDVQLAEVQRQWMVRQQALQAQQSPWEGQDGALMFPPTGVPPTVTPGKSKGDTVSEAASEVAGGPWAGVAQSPSGTGRSEGTWEGPAAREAEKVTRGTWSEPSSCATKVSEGCAAVVEATPGKGFTRSLQAGGLTRGRNSSGLASLGEVGERRGQPSVGSPPEMRVSLEEKPWRSPDRETEDTQDSGASRSLPTPAAAAAVAIFENWGKLSSSQLEESQTALSGRTSPAAEALITPKLAAMLPPSAPSPRGGTPTLPSPSPCKPPTMRRAASFDSRVPSPLEGPRARVPTAGTRTPQARTPRSSNGGATNSGGNSQESGGMKRDRDDGEETEREDNASDSSAAASDGGARRGAKGGARKRSARRKRATTGGIETPVHVTTGGRPRPKDRQQIQERIAFLRQMVPDAASCSIDGLLEKAIKHMHFLQSVTRDTIAIGGAVAGSRRSSGEVSSLSSSVQPGELKEAVEAWESRPRALDSPGVSPLGLFEQRGGQLSASEPVVVEHLKEERHLLVEIACPDQGIFLEIAEGIRSLGLVIKKGVMERRHQKLWARFIVETPGNVDRVQILGAMNSFLHPNQTTPSGRPFNSPPNGLVRGNSLTKQGLLAIQIPKDDPMDVSGLASGSTPRPPSPISPTFQDIYDGDPLQALGELC